ncbi:MAG: DUF2723 domain-containing protein [Gemmatimonadetes bacterium]|nr:DUF2723 domain-containing protein [Gemmatimonadota bacterium]
MARPETKILRASEAAPAYRPPYRWAGAVFAVVLILYALTLAPTTSWWDTSEYIATAHILGIPHPPGNPLFVILGRTWDLLLSPFPLSTAAKINLLSAALSAGAAAFWFLVAHRVLAFFSEDRTFRLLGAWAATALSATAFTVWNQSVVNEKVYTFSLFTIALLSWLAFRWRDNLGRAKDDNLLILFIYVLALSMGNHLMGILVAPALAVFVLWIRPSLLRNWRLYGYAALFGAAGLTVQMVLPIRAARDPVIAEADPKCESVVGAAFSILSLGKSEACPALAASLERRQYNKPPITLNPIHARVVLRAGGRTEWVGPPRDVQLIKGQVGTYLQYFNWQWARGLGGDDPLRGAPLRPFVTAVFALLILYGAWRHWQRDRTSWIFSFVLFATLSAGIIIYLNFKYGYSLYGHLPHDWREVRERDYFWLLSFSFSGVWAGIGLASVWQTLAGWLSRRSGFPVSMGYRQAAPVLALALVPLVFNWQRASRAGDYAARDWAYNLLNSVEPYGVLFTNGDNDTFPLWYAQEVEGIRRDVIVIVYSYLGTEWYPRQLRDLSRPCDGRDPLADPRVIVCQRPFEPETAVSAYRGGTWSPPTRAILGWNDDEIRGLFDSALPRGAWRFVAGEIDTVIPAEVRLLPNDLFILGIIQHSIGDRPIYFASTTDAFRPLQLDRYLVRQGLAYRVNNGPIDPRTTNLARVSGLPIPSDVQWVDLARTEPLLWEQFVYRELLEKPFWPDHSTQGIPAQYYRAHIDLAAAYAVMENEPKLVQNVRRGEEFLALAVGRKAAPALPVESLPGAAGAETAEGLR